MTVLLHQLLALDEQRVIRLRAQRRVISITASSAKQQHGERGSEGESLADSHQAVKGIEGSVVRSKFRRPPADSTLNGTATEIRLKTRSFLYSHRTNRVDGNRSQSRR